MIGDLDPLDRVLHQVISRLHDELRIMTTRGEVRNLRQRLALIAPRLNALVELAEIKDERLAFPEPVYQRELAAREVRWLLEVTQ